MLWLCHECNSRNGKVSRLRNWVSIMRLLEKKNVKILITLKFVPAHSTVIEPEEEEVKRWLDSATNFH